MEDYSKYIEELKIRISEGDFDGLNELYEFYFKKLKLYGIQFSPKLISFSIEDLIQELFLWMAKNHQKLKEIDNIEVYLFCALKKNIYQEIYKKQNRNKLQNRFLNATYSNQLETSPEFKFIESENKSSENNYVADLLNTLPPKQKEVLYLRNYINLSYREIATIMNLSEQVVRNYGYRALQKLRTEAVTDSRKKEV